MKLGWRRVDVFGEELRFAWFCTSQAEAEAVLAAAVSVLLEVLPSVCRCTAVRSMRFLNPETGFAIDPNRLREIVSDFGPESARLLLGERVEYGTLVVNDIRLEGLDVDARSPLAGHFSVDLPTPPRRELLGVVAEKSGFQLGDSLRPDSQLRRSGSV